MFGGIGSRALVALCLGVLTIAGCGDDGGDSTAEGKAEPVKFSAAGEPPDKFMKRAAKLIETSTSKADCLELDEINRHSLSRFQCPTAKELQASMKSFEVVDAKEYGTGAVVDYKSGEVKDGAAILLFVAPDRQWGISRFGIITSPSTKTSDAATRAGYEKAVEEYLTAVRERDCKAFTAITLIDDSQKDVCNTVFADSSALGRRLRRDRSAKPKYLGGNATFGFFSIETEVPVPILKNETISIIKTPAGASKPYLVLDSASSVTSEEQERVRRAYRIQQEEGGSNPNDMTPSTKPSTPSVKQ